MAIAKDVFFLNDMLYTFQDHANNVKSEVRQHKIEKFSDLIVSQCKNTWIYRSIFKSFIITYVWYLPLCAIFKPWKTLFYNNLDLYI